jgi:hypothetical protein
LGKHGTTTWSIKNKIVTWRKLKSIGTFQKKRLRGILIHKKMEDEEVKTPKVSTLRSELPKILVSALFYALIGAYGIFDQILVTGFIGKDNDCN